MANDLRTTASVPRTPKQGSKSDKAVKGPSSEDKQHALTADKDLSPAATVLREVARLQLDNTNLKRQNLRVWSLAGFMGVGTLAVIGAAFWWFPHYRYIATVDAKAICEVETQQNAIVSAATIEDFAKDAVINAYSYDYVNYRSIIDDTTNRWFTDNGRKAFNRSLDDSGNLERVVKGRLIMRTFTTNAPQLEKEGDEGRWHYWIVDAPVAIEFYVGGAGSPNNTQDFMAEVKVMQQSPTALNPKGISVDSIVLHPTVRSK
jgi:intracellular multiplication protein IcmL